MTKKLRFLMTALLLAVCGMTWAEDIAYKTQTFSSTTMQKGVTSYTDTWENACDGFTWVIEGFNNNNKQWSLIKCGRKNNEHEGSIITKTAIDKAITKVAIEFGKVSNVTSAYLYVAKNDGFSSGLQSISFTPTANSTVYIPVTTPTENCYYKITINSSAATSNGTTEVKNVVYYKADDGSLLDADVTIGETSLIVGESTTVSNNGSDVVVVLESSDTDVVTVDGTTVTAVGSGEATITATWEETENYNAGSITFTVTVTAPLTVEDGVFNFNQDQLDYDSGLTPKNSYGNNEYELSSTWVAGNVTMNVVGRHRWWKTTSGSELRLYAAQGEDAAGTATVSVPEGYVITNIAFTFSGSNNNIKFDEEQEGEYNSGIWTGSSQSVEFTRTSNCYITSITVTYEQAETPTPEAVPFTIKASNGYGTFCSEYPVQFTPNDNVEVYIATGINEAKTSIQTQKIEDGYVPAGVGVIVKASAAGDFTVHTAEATDVETLEGNLMVGCTVDTPAPAGCYILYAADGCFHPCSGGTIPAGKAYLNVNSESKNLNIEVGELDPTAIHEMEAAQENADIYTLDGVRVKDAQQKGIYIINGKKVVIK